MRRISSLLITTFVFFVLVTGCEQREAPNLAGVDDDAAFTYEPWDDGTNEKPMPQGQELDKALRNLLISHSQGQGLNFFQLPASDDFANIPQDPMNPLNGFKTLAGMYLFNDPILAVSNIRPEGKETYSCGSCHPTEAAFYANLPQAIGEGGSGYDVAGSGRTFNPAYDSSPDDPDVQPIRAPTILNVAFQEVVMWDGKLGGTGPNIGTESQWTPGTPLESNTLGMMGPETQSHGGLLAHRLVDIDSSAVVSNFMYVNLFNQGFPDSAINRLNVAKAIAAFERTVLTNQAPFQNYVKGDFSALTTGEKRGALLFFGKAGCVSCHTGPALNTMTFHALGMKDIDGSYDLAKVNLAPFGGTVPDNFRKGRGGFTGNPADDYKFKTPQLYNLKDSPYYGHGASFATVREVIEYKNRAVKENAVVPLGQLAAEFVPLGLKPSEVDHLVDFVENALHDPNINRFRPGQLQIPSGICSPSADPVSASEICGASVHAQDNPNPKRFRSH